jgi:hypothetical protein
VGFEGSVPTGDQCRRGISADGGSVHTGDQWGSGDQGRQAISGVRGISAYGESGPRGISAYGGSVPTGACVTGHRGFYLRVSSIKKMLSLWPLARG